MVRFSSRIVKLNPSYFAFLSGALISISTNLLTALVFSGFPAKLEALAWGVMGAFFVASIAWAALAFHLEGPHQHWVIHWRDAKTHHELKEADVIQGAIGGKSTLVSIELVVGLNTALIGIVLLIASAVIR